MRSEADKPNKSCNKLKLKEALMPVMCVLCVHEHVLHTNMSVGGGDDDDDDTK